MPRASLEWVQNAAISNIHTAADVCNEDYSWPTTAGKQTLSHTQIATATFNVLCGKCLYYNTSQEHTSRAAEDAAKIRHLCARAKFSLWFWYWTPVQRLFTGHLKDYRRTKSNDCSLRFWCQKYCFIVGIYISTTTLRWKVHCCLKLHVTLPGKFLEFQLFLTCCRQGRWARFLT